MLLGNINGVCRALASHQDLHDMTLDFCHSLGFRGPLSSLLAQSKNVEELHGVLAEIDDMGGIESDMVL